MEETTETTTASAAENTEPISAPAVESTEVVVEQGLTHEEALALGNHVNTDFPADSEVIPPTAPTTTEPTQEELDAAAAVVLAAAALVVAEEAFVALPGHEIQHTAHLTDGPPWN